MKRKTLDEVKKQTLEMGFEFLDLEYLGTNHRHKFRCLKHDMVHLCKPGQIICGKGLRCCSSRYRGIRLDFEKVKSDLLKRGFEFVAKTFIGIKYKYAIKCLKHDQVYDVYLVNMIHRGDGLRCCQKEKVSGK
jgi:hypothetical protein